MSKQKEERWNEDTKRWETNHDAWLSEYEYHTLEEVLMMRILQTQALRNKCGISPDDMESEPNQRIHAMRSIAEKFGIQLLV